MRDRFPILLVLSLLVSVFANMPFGQAKVIVPDADVVLYDAKIYTGDVNGQARDLIDTSSIEHALVEGPKDFRVGIYTLKA